MDASEKGKRIYPPLKMTPPQQLIAIFMLGISMDNMLQPTWFGFEMMSTHFVKCAIAASATVCKKLRPSVKDALACLGFTILDEKATDDDVKKTWKKLGKWVPCSTVATRELTPYHSNTRQLDVGLAIVEETGEWGCEEPLRVETTLLDALANTRIGNDVQDDYLGPPIACVNKGNSPFCDGIVAFFAKPKAKGRRGELLSIMVQAKDYHGKSGISASDWNERAKVVGSSKHLDKAFGKTRLMCVASTHASLIATRRVTPRRKFLPFAVNRGSLLSILLEDLKEQRSERSRIAKYASYVDKDGKVVQGVVEGPCQQKAAGQGKKEKKGAAWTGKKRKNIVDAGSKKKRAQKAKTNP